VIRLASRALWVAAVMCVSDISPSGLLQTPTRSPYLCDPTPVEDRLPEAIAAMAGHSPVWGRRWSMIPGGATAQLMKEYAFIGSVVMYPSPGCWELTATLGDEEVRIVRDLRKKT
jgi:hypothetical protein